MKWFSVLMISIYPLFNFYLARASSYRADEKLKISIVSWSDFKKKKTKPKKSHGNFFWQNHWLIQSFSHYLFWNIGLPDQSKNSFFEASVAFEYLFYHFLEELALIFTPSTQHLHSKGKFKICKIWKFLFSTFINEHCWEHPTSSE